MLISVVTPTYNEELNVREVYEQVRAVMRTVPQYSYEHLFIDNASTDRTADILLEIASKDPQVKVILNTRNFGHIRSPYYGLLQAQGDAVILLVADLQDPPTLLPEFIKKWAEGSAVVMGVKKSSGESFGIFLLRKIYYRLVAKISGTELVKDFTGFGLYDRRVIALLRTINDPYPYFRGLIAELGFPSTKIVYHQPARKRGITKNNFYTLYDIAMLGITSHSKVPLRIATIAGFFFSCVGILIAFAYLLAKLFFWNNFSAGVGPLVIGGFTFLSLQLLFIGLIGEYVGAIHTQVLHRPIVVEKERINFDKTHVTSSYPSV